MTDAAIGFGTFLKKRTSTGPDVYTTIGEQNSVTPFGIAVNSVDATHMASEEAWREFIAGLIDGGETSIEINYVPGGAAEALLFAALRQLGVYRVTFPSGAYAGFSAIITGIETEAPVDDKMVATITLKISGKIMMAAAQAPVNSVSPAISGVIQAGQTLTAFEGVWAREPTSFTYQWKNEGANIDGATAKTYVPVAGDVGDNLTVAVTGINSAGNATATSPETIAVAAA